MARSPRAKADTAIADAWKGFYQTPHGRAAIADLMVWCNVYNDTGTTDPIQLAREAGEASVAKRIAGLIGLKPEAYPQQAWDDADILDGIMRNK